MTSFLLRRIPVGRGLWMISGDIRVTVAAPTRSSLLHEPARHTAENAESRREFLLCTGWLSVVNKTNAGYSATHTAGLAAGASIPFPTPELGRARRGCRLPQIVYLASSEGLSRGCLAEGDIGPT